LILISFFVGTNKYQISSFKVSPNFITFSANVTREFEQTFSGLKPKIFRITNFNEEVEKVPNKKEAFSTSLFQTFSLIQKAFFSSIELLGKKFQKLAYDSNKFIQDMFQMKTNCIFLGLFVWRKRINAFCRKSVRLPNKWQFPVQSNQMKMKWEKMVVLIK